MNVLAKEWRNFSRPPLDSRVIVLPTEIFYDFTLGPAQHIMIKLFQKVPNFSECEGIKFIHISFISNLQNYLTFSTIFIKHQSATTLLF